MLATASLTLAACGGNPTGSTSSGGSSPGSGQAGSITVGSANFPENILLADIYGDALAAQGVSVDKHLNIGSREVYIKALKDHSIDMIPEYTGNLLDYLAKGNQPTASEPQAVYQDLTKALPSGLTVADKAAAQDKDTVTVTGDTARKYHLETIGDLTGVAGKLVISGPPEFKTRRAGLEGLERVYGLSFKDFKPIRSGPLRVKALVGDTVQAANIFSTNPKIKRKHLVSLKDTKNLFTSQNVVPLLTKSKVTPNIEKVLNAVTGKLTTENLTDAVAKVTIDKQDADTVAKQFLAKHGLS